MSEIDERVWQLRNGIIQRLNNPEGLQEEVDALISAVQEQQKEANNELIDAIKSLAWSLVLADNINDVWNDVFEVVEAAGLPEPLQDSEGEWVMAWPIDPRYPSDEVERYEQALIESGDGE